MKEVSELHAPLIVYPHATSDDQLDVSVDLAVRTGAVLHQDKEVLACSNCAELVVTTSAFVELLLDLLV